jgi:D-alanine-D-alanine ligase
MNFNLPVVANGPASAAKKSPVIAVLYGGTSTEREVSLGSGRAVAIAMARSYPTQLIEITADEVPKGLDQTKHVVFSTLHGGFGEDGGMQRALDFAGISYAGCDSKSSALTMNKTLTKQAASAQGVTVAKALVFPSTRRPSADEVVAALGEQVVVKPNDQGSSVGLSLVQNREQLNTALENLTPGSWLIEERIVGRELSVGVLAGQAMGIVEIRPKSGMYDYASKYTKGMTQYLAPAPLDDDVTRTVKRAAETAFAACGCRDYARVDFILRGDGALYLLEINTLPGMKETSLLPMSAHCAGLDFTALVREMVKPALQRFQLVAQSLFP